MQILDLIFPKRCVQCKKVGDYLCPNCFSYLSFDVKNSCLICRRPVPDSLTHKSCLKRYAIDGCFSAIPYNKTAKKLIYNFKYKPFLSSLNTFLGDILYEALVQNENFNRVLQSSNNWIFVSIPLYPSKFRKRGYNHAEILAKELGKRFNIKAIELLKRVRDTKSQYGLKLPQRKMNMKGAFNINSKFKSQNSEVNVFLVDDIVTTGATLIEAANILKRNGAKRVYAITLARD